MGLKYYSKEIDNSKNFLPFSLNTDIPSYANTSISYHKNYQCPSSLSSSSSKMSMINTHPYTSIQNHNDINYSTQTSYYFRNNTYANISKSQVKSTYISNETILKNLTSMTSLSNTDIEIESQILDKNNQIYQNLKLCPKQLSSKIPFKYNKLLLHQKSSIDNINPYSSSHNYMNLQQQSIIPIDKILLKKNDYSSIYSIENEDSDIEINSNPNTTKIVKKLEVNLAPSCCDKRVLYRTKMPSSFHQQQKLFLSKHHHQHNNIQPIYTNQNYHTIQQQQQKTKRNSNINIPLHHPIITDKQLKHSLQIKSVSNQLYNEIQQTILNDNQSLDNIYKDKDLCEYPTDFHKILQDQIFAWYPTENYNEDDLIPQTHSILENEQSDKQDDITNLDEEEFCQHDTFEDFFLRRRPKSSCSTLATATKTIISDTISHDISSKPSLLNRRFPSIALGLDKTDVKFIHDIIERSHGDNRVSNRITALREAYIRAINKKLNLIKTKNNSLIDENKKKQHIKTIKHSYVTSKIRNELEKYDELPIHQRITFSDDDDDTYSINYQYQKHHCTIPIIVSTTHRILNFVSSLKQQLQEYIHHLRSRILIETTAKSPNHGLRRRRRFHHDLSGQSHRHVSRQKPIHNVVRHSKEHSHGIHRRQQLCRTHSNRSQLQHQLPSDEQHSSHRRRTFRIIPDQ
ncbi:unnamed protein product [Rotaria sp. Silwood1]|nr:unnamed protein product [Rotaria sp. Silwood1]CAF1517311.1 unnamed protein product [Rotaria sp. Silwood1]CAF3586071.1 unnamed protein product [Rotaria sp. Silwood1]CAF4566292.1 unnamed protein product [Rotaria sp. Silwood1]